MSYRNLKDLVPMYVSGKKSKDIAFHCSIPPNVVGTIIAALQTYGIQIPDRMSIAAAREKAYEMYLAQQADIAALYSPGAKPVPAPQPEPATAEPLNETERVLREMMDGWENP